jgi:hypothetical protein
MSFANISAFAVASSPGQWEVPLMGYCALTATPVTDTGTAGASASPSASPAGGSTGSKGANSLIGDTLTVTLQDLTSASTSGTGTTGTGTTGTGVSASPGASAGTGTTGTGITASPGASTGTGTTGTGTSEPNSVVLNLALQNQFSAATTTGTGTTGTGTTGTGTTASPGASTGTTGTGTTASPGASLGTTGPTSSLNMSDFLPYSVGGASDTTSLVQVSLSKQSIKQAALVGGAVAANGRSGYVVLDSGNGSAFFVNFVCVNLSAPGTNGGGTGTTGTSGASAAPASIEPSASASPKS